MILRPVSPQSPSGPPITNLPVGLTCHTVCLVIQPAGIALRTNGSTIACTSCDDRRSSTCWVDTTICVPSIGFAVLVTDRHLALGVGAERLGLPGLARVRHHLEDLVRVVDRRRHQLRRLAAG